MRSLKQFNQQTPLVIDRHNQVIVGNGRLDAMLVLKWKECQVIRTNLDGAEAEAYAIADNKTSDLSTFDYEKLAASMQGLKANGVDLEVTGFQDFEIEPILQAEWKPEAIGDMPAASAVGYTVRFSDEQWTFVQKALESIRESEQEFDTKGDDAALAAVCYRFTEGT
jgi:hypothetical protein